MIQHCGYASEATAIYRSILAGCKSSVALTKVFLKRIITGICNRYPEAITNVFVDDTNMQSIGTSCDDTLEQIVPAVTMFGDGARKMHLSLSPKAIVTANNPKLAKLLQYELSTYGMKFQVSEAARGLGISHTAGAKRPASLLISRFRARKTKLIKLDS